MAQPLSLAGRHAYLCLEHAGPRESSSGSAETCDPGNMCDARAPGSINDVRIHHEARDCSHHEATLSPQVYSQCV